MEVTAMNAQVALKRRGRPTIGPEPKTHEDNLERMRNYAKQRKDDAQEYRRLMQGLPRQMTVDEIIIQLRRININGPIDNLPDRLVHVRPVSASSWAVYS